MRVLRLFIYVASTLFVATSGWSASTPARQAGYAYLSPLPGAPYVSEQTRYVLVRFQNAVPAQITNLTTGFITVSGASSGLHPGSARVASDGRTVLFGMRADFVTNELVTVTLNPLVVPRAEGMVGPFSYQFMVTAPMPGPFPRPLTAIKPVAAAAGPTPELNGLLQSAAADSVRHPVAAARVESNGVSIPSDFPVVLVTVNSNPSPGCLFLEHVVAYATPYTMLVDNQGLPVWYRRGFELDFKTQPNGMITWTPSDAAGFSAFDQNFNYLKTYTATNGYLTDGHDFKMLPDGSYFVLGFRTNIVDMSRYISGGAPGSPVRENVVQGFTAAGDLILQWRAWDNYNIADENGNTDFPHFNGLDIDEDGNVLVSARHLSEITKIDRRSGDVIWRLSGAHSTFTFVNDPLNGTSFQHHVSALGGGRYLVFDNGNYHVPLTSRAVEYQVDLTNRTATMVWQFRDPPDAYTYFLGSAQRLTNGNTLVDFALPQYSKVVEVDTNGAKHFELSLIPGSYSYRAFRFPWQGAVASPYLILEPQYDNMTLVFNKFGDTNVAYYRIYEGPKAHPTNVVAESGSTLARLSGLTNGLAYFRVTAVSRDGVESPFSNEEATNVNIIPPGANMLQNGDFSQAGTGWGFNLSSVAIAVWSAQTNLGRLYITNGAESLTNVQLAQFNLPLTQSNRYVLDFDAWSSHDRSIGVELTPAGAPFTDYSHLDPVRLTSNRSHFHFAFTMQHATDLTARLLFNLGAGAVPDEVYLAKVSFFNSPAGDLSEDGRVNLNDLRILVDHWLKQPPGLPGNLDADGKVDFVNFDILGKNWGSGRP